MRSEAVPARRTVELSGVLLELSEMNYERGALRRESGIFRVKLDLQYEYLACLTVHWC